MSDREPHRRSDRRGASRSRERPLEEERGIEEVHVGGRTQKGHTRGPPVEADDLISPEGSPGGENPKQGDKEIVGGVKRMKFIELATRPEHGTAGKTVAIYANYYEITIPKDLVVYRYHVKITFANGNFLLNRDEKRQCFWQLVRSTPDVFGELSNILFDGDQMCICTGQLRFPTTNAEADRFAFNVPVDLQRLRQFGEMIRIEFKVVGTIIDINLREVEVAEPSNRYTTPLSVLDILFRQGRCCHLVNDSQGWYPWTSTLYRIQDRGTAPELGMGQEIWRGLFCSARVGEDYKAFVNLDVSHSAFYKDQSLIDFMIEILNAKFAQRGQRFTIDEMDSDTRLDDLWVRELNKELRGKKVSGVVIRQDGTMEQHEYRVIGIVDTNSLQETFPRTDPTTNVTTQVTVAQHFAERYGTLRYPSLNVVHVGGKRGPKLPMEHLRIITPQRVSKKLTPVQTSTMTKVAAMDARVRQLKIQTLANDRRFENDQWLNRYRIHFNNRMTAIPNARVLNPPRIEYAPVVTVREGSWNFQQQKFFIGGRCDEMGVIIVDGGTDINLYEDFFTTLLGVCRDAGVHIPESIPQINYMQVAPSEAMKVIAEKLEVMKEKGMQLVFVVLPEKKSPIPIYAEVKRVAEVMLGMMTQCVCKPTIQKTMEKDDRTVLWHMAMKMNTKLGGVNWKCLPEMMAKKLLSDKPTLILGIDVTHHNGSPRSKVPTSICSVVGNLDESFMKYGATVFVRKYPPEPTVHLVDSVRDRLVDYFMYQKEELAKAGASETEAKPQRIIVFRDGVSEGQFEEVLRTELVDIREACDSLASDYKPSVTVIVAQKGHHTRFFPQSWHEGCGRARNIFPGTVVDTVVTHTKHFDFYLCSHEGIQGTSRPIHYHVLTDDSKFSADEIQALTFHMTHCYARCTRAVSIPAPLYYADLARKRARDHLYKHNGNFREDEDEDEDWLPEDEVLIRESQIHPNLKMKMYFV